MLQTGTTNYIGQDQLDHPICYRDPSEVQSVKSPRVMHTHAPFRMLPDSWRHVIALVRDPRDVAVSYWHFIKRALQKPEITWDVWLENYMNGKCKSESQALDFTHFFYFW